MGFGYFKSREAANSLDQGMELGQQLSHLKLADDGKIDKH